MSDLVRLESGVECAVCFILMPQQDFAAHCRTKAHRANLKAWKAAGQTLDELSQVFAAAMKVYGDSLRSLDEFVHGWPPVADA